MLLQATLALSLVVSSLHQFGAYTIYDIMCKTQFTPPHQTLRHDKTVQVFFLCRIGLRSDEGQPTPLSDGGLRGAEIALIVVAIVFPVSVAAAAAVAVWCYS